MDFVTEEIIVKNSKVILHALVLKKQVLLIVTDQSLQAFNNLLITIQTKFDNLPSIINLSQEDIREDEEFLQILARSITKKLQMSLVFSFNLNIILDQINVLEIQKASVKMIQQCISNKNK